MREPGLGTPLGAFLSIRGVMHVSHSGPGSRREGFRVGAAVFGGGYRAESGQLRSNAAAPVLSELQTSNMVRAKLATLREEAEGLGRKLEVD